MDYTDFSPGSIWACDINSLQDMMARLPSAAALPKTPPAGIDAQKRDKIAIVPVHGPITRRAGLLSALFGAVSISAIRAAVDTALNDPDVSGVVLDIDSPGGSVSGELSDFLYAARSQKPVVAFSDGMMASAAYWIGSAAHKVVTEKTGSVGSIGLSLVHYDFSKADEMQGLKRTVISAGKYKGLGHDAAPLSQQAREVLQDRLNFIDEIFRNTVGRNRSMGPDAVLKAADGKVFIGAQAVEAGLADQTGNLSDAVELARTLAGQWQHNHKPAGNGQNVGMNAGTEDTIMAKTRYETYGSDFESLCDAYQEQHRCTKVEAMQAIIKRYPEAHRRYIEAANQSR